VSLRRCCCWWWVAARLRFVTAAMIPTRKSEDLLLGSWELIRRLGRVPRRPIWDNEAGIGWRGRLAQGVGRVRGDVGDQGGAIAAG